MFSLSICQIFVLSERWFSPRLFLFRFPLGVYAFFFQIPCVRRKGSCHYLIVSYGVDKRKSDRYMNFSGKEDHFCSESSMLGAVEGS